MTSTTVFWVSMPDGSRVDRTGGKSPLRRISGGSPALHVMHASWIRNAMVFARPAGKTRVSFKAPTVLGLHA